MEAIESRARSGQDRTAVSDNEMSMILDLRDSHLFLRSHSWSRESSTYISPKQRTAVAKNKALTTDGLVVLPHRTIFQGSK